MDDRAVGQSDKVFKIKYELNLILDVSQEDGSFMEALAETDELDIFR